MNKQEKITVKYIIQGLHSGIWDPIGTYDKLSHAANNLKDCREHPHNYTEHRLLMRTTIEEEINV